MSMNKMGQFVLCGAAALALAAGAIAPAKADDSKVELKASIFLPPSSSFNKGIDLWAKQVEEKSKGRIKINIFPSSQMGPPPRQFDLVRTGVVDFALVLHGLTPGRFPLTELAHLPGAITYGFAGSKSLSQIGPELLKADHPSVKILEMIAISPVPVITKAEVTKASDLKGKRVRAAGSVQSAVLDALGAVPVLIQPGEMNEALSKGMIEGASVGYSGIVTFHLAEANKFVFEGDLGSITFAWLMNEAAYNKLPDDLKKVIDETTGPNSSNFIGRSVQDEENELRVKYQKEGVKVQQLADDGPLKAASETIRSQAIANAESKGLQAKAFLEKLSGAYGKNKDLK